MIAFAFIFTALGIFFMEDFAKYYHKNDSFMRVVPRLISILLLVFSGVFWAIYFSN